MLLPPVGAFVAGLDPGTIVVPPPAKKKPIPGPAKSFTVKTGSATDFDLLAGDSPGDGSSLELVSVTVSAGSASVVTPAAENYDGPAELVGDAVSALKASTPDNYDANEPLEKFHTQPAFLDNDVIVANLNVSKFVDADGKSLFPSLVRGPHWFRLRSADRVFVDLTGDRDKYPGVAVAVEGVADEFDAEPGVTTRIDPLANDKGGPDEIAAAPTGVPSGHTAVRADSNRKIDYTSPAAYTGKPTFSYIPRRSSDGSTGLATLVTMDVKEAAVGVHNWRRAFPGAANVDKTKIKVWNWPGSPPTHNKGDLLLLVLPNKAHTGVQIGADGIKGPVVCIGGKLEPAHTSKRTISGREYKTSSSLLNLNFAEDAESHWSHAEGTRPFFWMSNVDADFADVDSMDWVRLGLGKDFTKQVKGTDRRVDYYRQKCRVKNGPVYIDYDNADGHNGHSDGIQLTRGGGVLRSFDNWIEWRGGMVNFIGRCVEYGYYERGRKWLHGNNYYKCLPVGWTGAPTHTQNAIVNIYMTGELGYGGDPVEVQDYAKGAYQPQEWLATDYIHSRGNSLANADVKSHINPQYGMDATLVDATTQLWQFKSTFPTGATYPYCKGPVKLLKASDPVPTGLLDPAHVGLGARITTVDQLWAVLGRT